MHQDKREERLGSVAMCYDASTDHTLEAVHTANSFPEEEEEEEEEVVADVVRWSNSFLQEEEEVVVVGAADGGDNVGVEEGSYRTIVMDGRATGGSLTSSSDCSDPETAREVQHIHGNDALLVGWDKEAEGAMGHRECYSRHVANLSDRPSWFESFWQFAAPFSSCATHISKS